MIDYNIDKELTEVVEHVYQTEKDFEPMRTHKIGVLAVMKVNNDAHGEPKPCTAHAWITCKKLGGAERVFIEDAHYILIVDYGRWNESGRDDRERMIHHALSGVSVTVTDSGKLKLGRVPPIVMQKATVERYHGLYMPSHQFVLPHLRPIGAKAHEIVQKAYKASKAEPEPEPETPAEEEEKPRVRSADEIEAENEEKPPLPPPRRKPVNKP